LAHSYPRPKVGTAFASIAIISVFIASAFFAQGSSPGETTSTSTTQGSTTEAQVIMTPAGAVGNQVGYYYPDNLTVLIGVNSTVKWTNEDMLVHSVYFDIGAAYSGNIEPGKSWTYTFNAPGIYSYHCYLHPWIDGTVTVKKAIQNG
jgi:plastocyanin